MASTQRMRTTAPKNIEYGKDGTHYDILFRGKKIGKGHLIVPGRHNVLNALGALAAARELGLSVEEISRSLEKFTGAKRRFETKGRVRGIWVVDDYAHHPTEIKVTLKLRARRSPNG